MGILDLVFPKNCLECGSSGSYICDVCLANVGRGSPPALFKYQGVIKKAILALKYKFVGDVAGELSRVCIQRLKERRLAFKNVVLVPVPLHRKRKNWRGFNQTEEVGTLIAKDMGWEYKPRLLQRILASTPQVGLTGTERARNIRGKFAVNTEQKEKIGNQKPIIVFDDVWTTGATVREAIGELKKGGFKSVWGLTIAR